MRRAAIALLAASLLVACGDDSGGGGSQQAFCDQAPIALGHVDLATGDAGGVANADIEALTNSAPAEIRDDMATINAALTGASTSTDVNELLDAYGRVRDYVADKCDIELAVGPRDNEGATTTTLDFGGETTTSTPGETGASTTDTTATTGTDGTGTTAADVSTTDPNLPDPDPVPGGDDEQLNELAEKCHDGDMQACDDLFNQSDVDSAYEDYGNTCGGRVPDNTDFCVDVDF